MGSAGPTRRSCTPFVPCSYDMHIVIGYIVYLSIIEQSGSRDNSEMSKDDWRAEETGAKNSSTDSLQQHCIAPQWSIHKNVGP